MRKVFCVAALLVAMIFGGVAGAQFPILDTVADKVIQKYQQSTCEQLWQQKGQPKPRDGAGNRSRGCAAIREMAPPSSTK